MTPSFFEDTETWLAHTTPKPLVAVTTHHTAAEQHHTFSLFLFQSFSLSVFLSQLSSIMPNISHPTGQDWEPVNAGQSHAGARFKTPKTARELLAAKEAGLVSTEKRFGAGGNASAHSSSATIMSARKLEEADEPSKILKVDKSLSKAIMQARTAKKMTQKDLATAINEKPQVVAEYESGKAIPNPQIITKLERKLGCKLPRPGKQTITTSSSSTVKKATTTGTSSGLTAKQASLTRGGPPKRR